MARAFPVPAHEADAPTETMVPHHRALVVQLWAALLLCLSSIEWAGRRETATQPAAVWVYVVLALVWPITPLVYLVVVRWMSARLPFATARWRQYLAAHAGVAALLVAFDVGSHFLTVALSPVPIPAVEIPHGIRVDLLSYAVMVMMFELGRRSMQYRRMELARAALGVQVAEARRRRTEAELHALKAELNPHFLGNALASVAALLKTDVDAADRTLAQLGELVGRLGRRGTHEVTLEEELEGLAPVLEYERLRLSGHLEVSVELAAGAGDAFVPDMILHPLIENAVKYGLAPYGGGSLRIEATRGGPGGASLVLSVHDTASRSGTDDASAPAEHGGGLGLSNVRSRLAELYGESATLVLHSDGPGRSVARVTMPWRDDTTVAPERSPSEEELELGDGQGVPPVPGRRAAPASRLRVVGVGAGRVAALVAAWVLFSRWFTASALATPLPPLVRPDDVGTLIDAMCTAGLRVAMIAAGIALVARSARRVTTSPVLPLHLLVGFAFGMMGTIEKVTIISLRDPARWVRMPGSHLARNVTFEILIELVWYLAVAGAATAAAALWRTRWSHASRLRLHQRLEEERHLRVTAELRTLQSELNPHFVGNALSVVSSLLHTDRDAATRLLAELGVVLRAALSRAATHEVTLRDELHTLRAFLEVEHARLGRRMDIHWRVEEGALDGRVPHMILQPLVENAVMHGLAPRHEAGRIDIEATRGDRELELVVRDDGVGLAADGAPRPVVSSRHGVGLANTRARLSELYGPVGRLDISRGEEGGTVARVRIPWHLDSMTDLALVAGGGTLTPPPSAVRPAIEPLA